MQREDGECSHHPHFFPATHSCSALTLICTSSLPRSIKRFIRFRVWVFSSIPIQKVFSIFFSLFATLRGYPWVFYFSGVPCFKKIIIYEEKNEIEKRRREKERGFSTSKGWRLVAWWVSRISEASFDSPTRCASVSLPIFFISFAHVPHPLAYIYLSPWPC